MLTAKQKNAIENLLILVDYVKDNSVYSDEDGKLIEKSISIAEELIGRSRRKEEGNEAVELLAKEIKNRFKP
jgi:hypothetical protein